MSSILADENVHIDKDLTAILAELSEEFSKTPGLLVVLSEGRYRLHRPPEE